MILDSPQLSKEMTMLKIQEYQNIEYMFKRRRYGSRVCGTTRFFTWLMWRKAGSPGAGWETYGDPWPKVKLNKKELKVALDDIIATKVAQIA